MKSTSTDAPTSTNRVIRVIRGQSISEPLMTQMDTDKMHKQIAIILGTLTIAIILVRLRSGDDPTESTLKSHDSFRASDPKATTSSLDHSRAAEGSNSGIEIEEKDMLNGDWKRLEAPVAFEEEKEAFYRTLNLSPAQFRDRMQFGTPQNPDFQFYVNRMKSEDSRKAGEAFRLLVSAIPPRNDWDLDPTMQAESDRMFAVFYGMETIARFAPGDYPVEKLNYPEVYDMIMTVLPRLENPMESLDAIRLINAATLRVYEDKDILWWQKSFANSKLAGILRGLPREEWIDKTE